MRLPLHRTNRIAARHEEVVAVLQDISRLGVPLSETGIAEYRRITKAVAEQHILTLEAETYAKFTRADAWVRLLVDRLDRVGSALTAADERYRAGGQPSVLRTSVEFACLSIVLAGEAVLSYSTLPPLLGLAPDSAAALPIAAAVVAGTVAIERILDPVLTRLGVSASGAHWVQRASAGAALGAIVIAGVAGNFDMFLRVAAAREEASRILGALMGAGDQVDVEINGAIVGAAVRSLSVVIVFNAAVLLRSVFHDVPLIGQRARAWWCRAIANRSRRLLSRAESELATRRRDWETREQRARTVLESSLSAAELAIEQHRQRHKPSQKPSQPTDRVDRILENPRLFGALSEARTAGAPTVQ